MFLAVEPDGGLGTRFVRLVEHPELVSRGPDLLQQTQGAFAHENPATDAVADELDHVDAPFLQLRESEGAGDPPHGRFLELYGSFTGGGEAVQLDARVDLLALAQVVVEGIDLELLDQKRLDVLGPKGNLHLFTRGEAFLVGVGEVEIHAVLEGLHLARAQHGVPLLRISQTRSQLGLGEDFLEVVVAHVFYETVVILVLKKEMEEMGADEGIVVADSRKSAPGDVVGVEVDPAVPSPLDFRVPPDGVHVVGVAGQLEVLEEEFAIPDTLLPLKGEQVVQDVRLEGVEGGRQTAGEAELTVQPLAHLRIILTGIDVGGGRQFREVGMDEVGVVDELTVNL